uniref:Globin n=1 Tax=Aplanochytrium stocchinoi TaxID=215587 RepID=A0A7S3PQL9_9STRA
MAEATGVERGNGDADGETNVYERNRKDILNKGRKIRIQGAFLMGSGRKLIRKEDITELMGGREGFLRIFTRFYERLHDDPLMRVLFNESKEERTPQHHGEILGSFILASSIGDKTYFSLKGSHGIRLAHQRAKSCPLRDEKHQGRGFTDNQSLSWLAHLSEACDDLGVPEEFRDRLTLFLGAAISRYGPFISDD